LSGNSTSGRKLLIYGAENLQVAGSYLFMEQKIYKWHEATTIYGAENLQVAGNYYIK
jgi:hypothetical protein